MTNLAPGRLAVRASAFLLAAAAFWWSAHPVSAGAGAADTGVAVSPPRVEMAIDPGQSRLEGAITVSNTVARAETVDLALVDLLVDGHGAYQVAAPGSTGYSVSTHSTLDPVRLELAPKGQPGSSAQVRLEVLVDRPQPLYGGILVTPHLPDAPVTTGGLGVRLQPRALVPLVAMPVAEAGDLSRLAPQTTLALSDPRLRFAEAGRGPLDGVIPFDLAKVADHAPLAASLSARNTGNTYARLFTHYRFESVNLLDWLPARLRAAIGAQDTTFLDVDAPPGATLPGTVGETQALTRISSDGRTTETAPVFGIVRVRAVSSMRVLDARSDETVEESYLLVIPWKAMLLLAVLLVALAAVRQRARRRPARPRVHVRRTPWAALRGAVVPLMALPRHVLALGVLTVLMAVALAGQAAFADDTSAPASAALAYLEAQSRLDAAATWSAISVAPVDAPAGTDSSLLTRDALAAALSQPEAAVHRLSEPRVRAVSVARDEASADVSFRVDGALRKSTLTLVRDPAGAWRVLVIPAVVAVQPAGLAVTVDGVRPSRPAAAGFAVLPGFHRVAGVAVSPWQSAATVVDARDAFPRVAEAVLGTRLEPAAAAAAAAAVTAAFAPCLASTAPAPAGCPNSIPVAGIGPVRWDAVGAPADGATFAPGPGGTVVVSGHFTLIASYQVHRPEGVRRLVSGGGYRLTLSWDGKRFQAESAPASAAGLLPLSRPAAGEALVKAALDAAFAACAGWTSSPPPGCPVPAAAPPPGGRWQWTGDPAAASTITWDGEKGVFEAAGSYAASAGSSPVDGRYVAHVAVEPGGPRVIAIDAA